MKIIAIEEHFWSPGLRDSYPDRQVAFMRGLTGGGRLDEVNGDRTAEMDEVGIDVQVLSQWQPGAQDCSAEDAVHLAADSNDFLFARIQERPTRFRGFATLPTPDPVKAARELERCVTRLGFVGALINGHTNGAYLDEIEFRPILEAAAALNVPIYLHPRTPHPAVMGAYFKNNFTLSQAAWGYAIETGTHALRMIMGGVFDDFPTLQIILGHLGEGIPYYLWRFDHSVMSHTDMPGSEYTLKKRPREYFLENFHVTTSGDFDPIAMECAIKVMGADRVLFATDYPVESLAQAVDFLKSIDMPEDDRNKIAHGNAAKLLRL